MRYLSRVLPYALPLAVLVAVPARAQTPASAPAAATIPVAAPEDVRSPDAIIAALYDVISGPAGQPRNWDRMRSLFAPGGRLIPAFPAPDGTVRARVWAVDDYIAQVGPNLDRNGFFEREISRTSETYGTITHAFSTYEARRTPQDTKLLSRGINSIQLLNDGKRWYVVTVYWDSERPNNPIPQKYLR